MIILEHTLENIAKQNFECYTFTKDIEIQNESATASLCLVGNSHLPLLGSINIDCNQEIMDSDSLGIHVHWVKTQLRFIITAFHKAQLNSNSTLPAEPVDSTQVRFFANKLGSIHMD